MKKKILCSFFGAVIAVCSIYFTGCTNKAGGNVGNVEVWHTYNTVKVMRDKHDYEKSDGALVVEMAKNETEGAQLVITAVGKIEGFDVRVSDLYCGDSIIPSGDINVYVQKYIDIKLKTNNSNNPDFPVGYTPDCLLPMSVVKAYGENKIEKGRNQGITIEVTSKKDTPAGEYVGNVTVSVDGKEKIVPINVTVWDIELTSNSRSVFMAYPKDYLFGEMDSTFEMQEKYFEAMLDYKLCIGYIQGSEYSPEKMVESLDKYWDHPNFTTYSLPSMQGYSRDTVNVRYYKQYLKYLAKASSPNRNYLEKAVNYVLPCDEPWARNSMETVKNTVAVLQKTDGEVASELEKENFYAQFGDAAVSFKEELENSLNNIQHIITDQYRGVYTDSDLTFCPTFDKYESETMVENLKQHSADHNNDLWWYGCVNPKYPYPTYHIDDSLIGARAVGWMQKQYGIKGNLFWNINTYQQWFTDVGTDTAIDPYEEPNRIGWSYRADANGDGYFFYPGKKYGSDKPFPSLRLMTIRDGNDDYDLLSELEKSYTELETYYGLPSGTLALAKTIDSVFDKIGIDVQYSSDAERIYAARRTIANLIRLADSDAKLVVLNDGIGKNADYRVFAANGYEVSINSAVAVGAASGSGKVYEYALTLDKADNYFEVEAVNGEDSVKYTERASGKVEKVTDFSHSMQGGITTSKGTTYSVNASNGTLDFTVVSYGNKLSELMSFTPYLSIDKSELGVTDFSKVEHLSFTLYNKSDTESEVIVALESLGSQLQLKRVKVGAHASVDILIKDIGDREWSDCTKADKLTIKFENVDDNSQKLPDREFAISEIFRSLKN